MKNDATFFILLRLYNIAYIPLFFQYIEMNNCTFGFEDL